MPMPRLLIAGLAVLLLAAPTGAQDSEPESPGRSTLQGVYASRQASRGEATYQAKCTACHAPTAYTGEAFSRVWATRTVFDLFERIRTTMPMDEPGSLSRAQYAEVVAYLLKLNGYPAGRRPLPADREGLRQIRIEPR